MNATPKVGDRHYPSGARIARVTVHSIAGMVTLTLEDGTAIRANNWQRCDATGAVK